MAAGLEDLRVLKAAEGVADAIWKDVSHWDEFARNVVGGQLARAADSIGANIAESFGRFNYGEKLQFLYYSRGSLFETKYWLNRCLARTDAAGSRERLYQSPDRSGPSTEQLRRQPETQRTSISVSKMIREHAAPSVLGGGNVDPESVFEDVDLHWLESNL